MIEFIIMVLHNYLKEMSIKHEIQWKEKHCKIEYFGQFFCMSIKRLHMVYATSYTVEWGWSLEIHTWQKPTPLFSSINPLSCECGVLHSFEYSRQLSGVICILKMIIWATFMKLQSGSKTLRTYVEPHGTEVPQAGVKIDMCSWRWVSISKDLIDNWTDNFSIGIYVPFKYQGRMVDIATDNNLAHCYI